MGDDNASGTLKLAIGLAITMIVIAIIVVAFNFARSHANNAITTMSKSTSQIEESRYTQYDGSIVTGAEVLNIINQFENDEIFVGVTTATVTTDTSTLKSTDKGATTYVRDKNDGTGKKLEPEKEAEAIRKAKNIGEKEYINPSSQFYGIVNRSTDTNAIIGVSFFRIN